MLRGSHRKVCLQTTVLFHNRVKSDLLYRSRVIICEIDLHDCELDRSYETEVNSLLNQTSTAYQTTPADIRPMTDHESHRHPSHDLHMRHQGRAHGSSPESQGSMEVYPGSPGRLRFLIKGRPAFVEGDRRIVGSLRQGSRNHPMLPRLNL